MKIYGLQMDTTDRILPFTPALQLLYVNGRYAQGIPRYGRGRTYIDVIGDGPSLAMWLDVEKGDATIGDVPGWLAGRMRAGLGTGGIYCSRDNLALVEEAAADRPHLLGVATLDGTTDITPPPGIGVLAFIQAYSAEMIGANWDVSVVVDADYWTAHALI
jgi:hypothetical protein